MSREWKYNKGEFVKTVKFSRHEKTEAFTEDGTKINKDKGREYQPFVGQIVAKRGYGGDTVHEYLIRPAEEGRLKQFKGGEFIAPNDATPDLWVSEHEIEGKA